jgi:hypothetical protein
MTQMNADEKRFDDFFKRIVPLLVFIGVHLRHPRSSASGFSTTERPRR